MPSSTASGNGGNKIYVFEELDMVVVLTSSAYNLGHGHRRSRELMKSVVAAALSQ